MNVLELFAGAVGGIYGGLLLGHTPVCAVEIVAKNRELLLQRQRDGIMLGRVANGVADWEHRIFALGNGQVPRVHAAAWRILRNEL